MIDGLRHRGLIGDGWLTDEGRAVEQRFEDRTDDLATRPYEALEPDELEELVEWVTPGSARGQPRR